MAKKLRLAIMFSGGGRTMVNIAEHIARGELDAEIVCVISSRGAVAGVERAQELGLEPHIVRRKDFDDDDKFSVRLAALLHEARPDLICLCGWLCWWRIPDAFLDRVINIHPSLLPAFGGQGMWGQHVHEAVLRRGCKISGCTVHFVNNEYDQGPIILQRCCPVAQDDTPDTLAARVFEQECLAYPEAIRLFGQGRLRIVNGIVKIAEKAGHA